jgi:hypothetical protein
MEKEGYRYIFSYHAMCEAFLLPAKNNQCLFLSIGLPLSFHGVVLYKAHTIPQ